MAIARGDVNKTWKINATEVVEENLDLIIFHLRLSSVQILTKWHWCGALSTIGYSAI